MSLKYFVEADRALRSHLRRPVCVWGRKNKWLQGDVREMGPRALQISLFSSENFRESQRMENGCSLEDGGQTSRLAEVGLSHLQPIVEIRRARRHSVRGFSAGEDAEIQPSHIFSMGKIYAFIAKFRCRN